MDVKLNHNETEVPKDASAFVHVLEEALRIPIATTDQAAATAAAS